MTREEWEALCDGCAKCCCIRLEDEDTGERADTNVVCALLDLQTLRCTDYPNRSRRVPACLTLSPDNVSDLTWMPKTCAYRLVAQGEDLPDWHPLKSGDTESVHKAGVSVRGRVLPETVVEDDDLFDHITVWPGEGDAEG